MGSVSTRFTLAYSNWSRTSTLVSAAWSVIYGASVSAVSCHQSEKRDRRAAEVYSYGPVPGGTALSAVFSGMMGISSSSGRHS